MGLLEFGLGKPIRMDIRPGFLKGIPVEIFWRTTWRRIAAGMLAAAAFLFNAVQLPAAALGELALGELARGELALGAWAEPGAWAAAPGGGKDRQLKVNCKRSTISDACTACR